MFYMSHFLHRLDGWPSAVIGVAVLTCGAYAAFDTYRQIVEEKELLAIDLESAMSSKYELIKKINEKEGVIAAFEGQISSITQTVGVLDKLAKTDEELLAKYSKVYFLNENYIPEQLAVIDEKYLNKGATNIEIHTQVWPYLERLLTEAARNDLDLRVASAYRSFGTQASLKSAYKVSYGSGANTFSADQGYSEHQLGTALDFTTVKLGASFSAFASDSAYKWLQGNAHRYGFILSYPQGNVFYKFEPWHWRFVGVKLATRLHDDNLRFYDWEQREIDKYLINLFD